MVTQQRRGLNVGNWLSGRVPSVNRGIMILCVYRSVPNSDDDRIGGIAGGGH